MSIETPTSTVTPSIDVNSLDPFSKGMYESFRTTTSDYLKLKGMAARKGEAEFNSEANKICENDQDYINLTEQIKVLTERKSEIYKNIKSRIKEEYELNNKLDPEIEQRYNAAQEMFKAGKAFTKLHFPAIYNAIVTEFGLSEREISPNGKKSSGSSGESDQRRIRGFTFVIGGVTFENATKASKFTGLKPVEFQQAFFAAQGSDNPKEWRSVEFMAGDKEVQANRNAK